MLMKDHGIRALDAYFHIFSCLVEKDGMLPQAFRSRTADVTNVRKLDHPSVI
jgi:hypothetical protein